MSFARSQSCRRYPPLSPMGLRAGGCRKLRFPLQRALGHLFTIGLASAFLCSTPAAELGPEQSPAEAVATPAPRDAVVYSKDWIQEYRSGEAGFCERAMDTYTWRMAGWGSNMNCLIATWLSGTLAGRKEIAVNVGGNMFGRLNCLSRSKARAEFGWECIYKPMPHLCTFDDRKEWGEFKPSREVSEVERGTSIKSYPLALEIARNKAKDALLAAGSDADIVGASAEILDHLNSNLQPWLKEDIDSVLDEEKIAKLRDSRFVGLHVRRGDKLKLEAKKVESSTYLDKAASIARQSGFNDSTLNAITGIWLSSDDSSVISEVRRLAPIRFPNVLPENVIWISDRVAVRPSQANVRGYDDELPTTVRGMTYDTVVGFFAELKMLSEAEIFVGTYSSNVARYVYLLRETNNQPRNTTASVDKPVWFPGRTLFGY